MPAVLKNDQKINLLQAMRRILRDLVQKNYTYHCSDEF